MFSLQRWPFLTFYDAYCYIFVKRRKLYFQPSENLGGAQNKLNFNRWLPSETGVFQIRQFRKPTKRKNVAPLYDEAVDRRICVGRLIGISK